MTRFDPPTGDPPETSANIPNIVPKRRYETPVTSVAFDRYNNHMTSISTHPFETPYTGIDTTNSLVSSAAGNLIHAVRPDVISQTRKEQSRQYHASNVSIASSVNSTDPPEVTRDKLMARVREYERRFMTERYPPPPSNASVSDLGSISVPHISYDKPVAAPVTPPVAPTNSRNENANHKDVKKEPLLSKDEENLHGARRIRFSNAPNDSMADVPMNAYHEMAETKTDNSYHEMAATDSKQYKNAKQEAPYVKMRRPTCPTCPTCLRCPDNELWTRARDKSQQTRKACVALPLWAHLLGTFFIVLLLVGVRVLLFYLSYSRDINVAFVGSSNLFANDVPRLVEAMGNGHIAQDSCLHGGGSLLNILKYGNGMYYSWQNSNAELPVYNYRNEKGDYEALYDYGACTVDQLLTGRDNNLAYYDQNGIYYDDGTNPCFQDSAYFDYQAYRYLDSTPKWDFVVLSDHARRMALGGFRDESIMALKHTYRPYFKSSAAIPIIVQPHAYWSDDVNMTGLGNVPQFTSQIYQAADHYRSFLAAELRWRQRPRIAPVGNAFLAVQRTNHNMWNKLFMADKVWPSAYGSLLYGIVIYATMYKRMPLRKDLHIDDVSELFYDSRSLLNNTFPSKNEVNFLYDIAHSVTLKGKHSKVLKQVSVSTTVDTDNLSLDVKVDVNQNGSS